MPELPEVETVRRALARWIPGSRLRKVCAHETRFRRPVLARDLASQRGARFLSVERRAKYLMFRTDLPCVLVMHLGMSGRIEVFSGAGPARRKHDHVVWDFESSRGDRYQMRFHDPRRFGMVLCLAEEGMFRHPVFAALGPEPFAADFDVAYLRAKCARSRRPVKNTLMDSTVVAGVGNIYACEALWRARVHPKTAAGRIGAGRWLRVRDAVREVLAEAIDAGGTTLNDYRDPAGATGYFRVHLHAYGRAGESCSRCGGKVRRFVQSGRATFYCPGCQR